MAETYPSTSYGAGFLTGMENELADNETPQSTNGEPAFLDRNDASGAREDLWRQSWVDVSQMAMDPVGEWLSIGPAGITPNANIANFMGSGKVSGIVTAIAIDPNSPPATPHIYVGTGEGGVWSSNDGGANWSHLSDPVPFCSVGALAFVPSVDPTKPGLLLGTGNLSASDVSGFTRGGGLYRSFDGGTTWAALDGGAQASVFAGRAITSILVLADRILVATNRNLFVTHDGGLTFSPVLSGRVTWVVRDTDTARFPDVVYACVSGIGIMVSTDRGATWKTNLFDSPPKLNSTDFNNVTFVQASSGDLDFMYASLQNHPLRAKPVFVGLFQSPTHGKVWARMYSAKGLIDTQVIGGVREDGQSDYDFSLGVDPLDLKRVYLGLKQLWISRDTGSTFKTAITDQKVRSITYGKLHFDHHCIAFNPQLPPGASPPSRVYVGTDGGIAYSDDGGQNWINPNSGLATNLVYSLGIGGGFYTYVGLQDNGTAVNPAPPPPPPAPQVPDPSAWAENVDGDGGNIVVDPTDGRIAYGFTNGLLEQTTDAGLNWTPRGNVFDQELSDFRCLALGPITQVVGATAANNRVLYVSVREKLYLSQTSGAAGLNDPPWKSFPTHITALSTTLRDPTRIWVGLLDGSVYRSIDQGASFNQVLKVQNMPVNAIAIDEADSTTLQRVAVCFGNFSGVSPNIRTQHVYLTTDDGATWNDTSGTDGGDASTNLPDAPAYDVVFDPAAPTAPPSRLIVALDGGVVHSLDDGKTWKRLGVGLPLVACTALASYPLLANPPLLEVATWGRSCYRFTSYNSLAPAAPVARLSSSSLGFGPVLVNGSSVLFVDIYNVGNKALNVTSFTVSAGSNAFSIDASGSPPGPVPSGGKTRYAVTFAPTTAHDLSASLQLKCDDPANATQIINVTGTGVAAGLPHLALSPNHLGFGTLKRNASADLTIKLLNTGYGDLTITDIPKIEGSSDFSITSAIRSPLRSGESEDVTVHFAPTIAFEPKRTAKFKVNCNDPYNGLATIDSGSNDPKAVGVFSVSGTSDIGISWLAIGLAVLGAAVLGGLIAVGATELIQSARSKNK